MSTVATLDAVEVEVLPGDEAVCGLRIRNDGPIVETYDLEVLGEAAQWTVPEPASLSVYPGTEGYVSVRFRPPRDARTAAGELRYGVRIVPAERPDSQVVPEGVVRVLPFNDTFAEIVPRTSQGRRGGRHEVAIDNRGNTPVAVGVAGTDADKQLAIATRPQTLVIGPGQAAFVNVAVRPRRPRWRGQPATFPFQVVVAPEDDSPLVLDAAVVQQPIIPRSAGRILIGLLALLLVLAGLWWAVLRPEIRSTAKEAVAEQIAPVAQQAQAADQNAQKAIAAAGGGASPAAPLPSPAGGTPPASPSPAPAAGGIPPGSTSLSRRLQSASGAGTVGTGQYTVPAGQILAVTDIYLQNPQGDEGSLELIVNGNILVTSSLANFRDSDYHTVSPIEAPAGSTVVLRTRCGTPGPNLAGSTGGAQCRVFALISGYQRRAPSPSPAP